MRNTLFPGRPNYVGPQRGWFAFVHHGKLFERATENIRARIKYIKRHKPKSEKRIRLNHVMYLGKPLGAKLAAMQRHERKKMWCQRICDVPEARALVLAYVKKHKPRNRWSERHNTLLKANGQQMTGFGP